MKSIVLALQGAALIASVAAQDAFLWTIDHGNVKYATSQASSISSDTASSILARRRGMTDDRSIIPSDEAALSDIKRYGGYQSPLFGADQDIRPERVMIRISGFQGSVSQFSSLPDLWIESPSKDLLDDFKARKNSGGICEYNLSIPTKKDIDVVYSYHSKDATCMSITDVEKLPSILTVYSMTPTVKDIDTGITSLLRTMSHLSTTGDVESTILVLPPASTLHAPKKRRSAQAEEPLDLPTSDPVDLNQGASTLQQSNSSHPLPKIVPQCFTNEATCNNVTNSCSGHGSCYRAYANCYKCKCGTTVINRDIGKKTTQWGGNACQKKDVSMPFALFATYGVVMTAVIAGGIGMLYSMGAQELPSVLGAGVSGPKSQK